LLNSVPSVGLPDKAQHRGGVAINSFPDSTPSLIRQVSH
jgi:hypothetical protein